jgi:hypothetical protein
MYIVWERRGVQVMVPPKLLAHAFPCPQIDAQGGMSHAIASSLQPTPHSQAQYYQL